MQTNPLLSAVATVLWFLLLIWATRYYSRWLLRIRTGEARVASGLFGPVEFGVAAGLASFLLIASIGATEGDSKQQITIEALRQTAVLDAVVVLVLIGILAARKLPLLDFLGLRLRHLAGCWRVPLFLFAAMALVSCAFILMIPLLGDAAKPQAPVEFFVDAAKAGDRNGLIMSILFSVLVAPVAEEMVFRGFIYPAFKRYFGMLPSMCFSAVLFALIHTNVAALLPLTVLAIALAIAFEATGSIAVPILTHAGFNALNIAFMLIAVKYAPEMLGVK